MKRYVVKEEAETSTKSADGWVEADEQADFGAQAGLDEWSSLESLEKKIVELFEKHYKAKKDRDHEGNILKLVRKVERIEKRASIWTIGVFVSQQDVVPRRAVPCCAVGVLWLSPRPIPSRP